MDWDRSGLSRKCSRHRNHVNSIDFPIVNGLKTTSNFFKTTDAAANWNNQNSGMVGSVNVIAVAPNAPNTIYAATSDGIYRSTDGGATWTKTTATGFSSFSFTNAMAVDPTNSSVVYAGHFFGLFKSTDGGNNWSRVNTAPLNFASSLLDRVRSVNAFDDVRWCGQWCVQEYRQRSHLDRTKQLWHTRRPNVRALAIDPTAPLTIYAGTSGNGFFKSTNGGGVWTAMNNGMGGGSPTFINAVVDRSCQSCNDLYRPWFWKQRRRHQ